MIRVTRITTVPPGKYLPMLNPELKEAADKREAILAKYQVSADLNSYQVTEEADGTKIHTLVTYYRTIEEFNRCVQELKLFVKNDGYHPDGTAIRELGPHSEITRKYRVVDPQTNEVLVDWTDFSRLA